jgi:protein-L-isoaspartate(D-aspartate) O-methyltransferase
MPDPDPPDERHARERESMVRDQLRRRGVRDPRVLDAMRSVPRERFLPMRHGRADPRAWDDAAVPIGRGQTLSQPYMVARMTEALKLEGSERVLEIGTGTGYQTAVLARLAAEVWTIERDPVLAEEARERLAELAVANVHFGVGDGTLGAPDGAPYDAILVTAGAPTIPLPLVAQLAPKGRLLIPVGTRDLQDLLLATLDENGNLLTRTLMACRFVPLVGEAGWPARPG